jgi:hypothetical protein
VSSEWNDWFFLTRLAQPEISKACPEFAISGGQELKMDYVSARMTRLLLEEGTYNTNGPQVCRLLICIISFGI